MKIGILGDLHIRSSKPTCRKDNYYEKQFEKLSQAFDTFVDNECRFIIQPGDFFNNYGKDPYSIVYDAIAFLMLYRIPVYLVFGQHDVKFHNTSLTDIPIQILNKTNLVHKLDYTPTSPAQYMNEIIHVYGSNWNESWPEKLTRTRKESTKILVTHEMIIKSKKLWPGQTDYKIARKICDDSKFDLIVSGDNHQSFSYKNRLINCGSLMRMREDQWDHKPIYGIYDTQTKELVAHNYDIDDPVLVIEKNERKGDKDEEEKKRKIFANDLRHSIDKSEMNFRNNVHTVMKRKRVRNRTKEIIEDSLQMRG